MFPHTVTIYNRFRENKVEKWQRTVLRNVFWNEISATAMRTTGAAADNKAQLIIPQANRAYMPPKEWKKAEDKNRSFTLQEGDTIVFGESRQEVEKSISEIEDGFIISSVDKKDFGGGMAIWEVGAK